MNPATTIKPSAETARIALRPESGEDEDFLFTAYASTREAELQITGWDASVRQVFLRAQFQAMRRGYRSQFPQAEFSIILQGAERIGRLVVNRTTEEIRLVDISILPTWQGQGIGTLLVRQLCDEAAATARPVRLHVLKGSPAIRLYEKLGFCKAGDAEPYQPMEWQPPAGLGAPN